MERKKGKGKRRGMKRVIALFYFERAP